MQSIIHHNRVSEPMTSQVQECGQDGRHGEEGYHGRGHHRPRCAVKGGKKDREEIVRRVSQ